MALMEPRMRRMDRTRLPARRARSPSSSPGFNLMRLRARRPLLLTYRFLLFLLNHLVPAVAVHIDMCTLRNCRTFRAMSRHSCLMLYAHTDLVKVQDQLGHCRIGAHFAGSCSSACCALTVMTQMEVLQPMHEAEAVAKHYSDLLLVITSFIKKSAYMLQNALQSNMTMSCISHSQWAPVEAVIECRKNLSPTLLKGLTELARNKPSSNSREVLRSLANWLLDNNPNKVRSAMDAPENG